MRGQRTIGRKGRNHPVLSSNEEGGECIPRRVPMGVVIVKNKGLVGSFMRDRNGVMCKGPAASLMEHESHAFEVYVIPASILFLPDMQSRGCRCVKGSPERGVLVQPQGLEKHGVAEQSINLLSRETMMLLAEPLCEMELSCGGQCNSPKQGTRGIDKGGLPQSRVTASEQFKFPASISGPCFNLEEPLGDGIPLLAR